MDAALNWSVIDTHEFREKPVEALVWRHDPQILKEAEKSEYGFYQNFERECGRIQDAGYKDADEKARIELLLNLIPIMVPGSNPVFIDCLTEMFDLTGNYLANTTDRLCLENVTSYPVGCLIQGNVVRALLEGALNNVSYDIWLKYVFLYVKGCKLQKGTRGLVWNENIFLEIGWPQPLDCPNSEAEGIHIYNPDLIALLCIYGRKEYAKLLVSEEFPLDDLILYSFQPAFWSENGHQVVNLGNVRDLCRYAVQELAANPDAQEFLVNQETEKADVKDDESTGPCFCFEGELANFVNASPSDYKEGVERDAFESAIEYLDIVFVYYQTRED